MIPYHGGVEDGATPGPQQERSRRTRTALLDAAGLHPSSGTWDSIARDFIQSRDHGLANIDALVSEWSARLPIPEQTIRTYLTTNIHYILDDECIAGMKAFFRETAALGILPAYTLPPLG